MSTPKPVSLFYERIWNAGDLRAASELLTQDFSFRGSLGTELEGRAAFTDYVRSIRAALADYRCDISECVTEGERAFARMVFSGRHVGTFREYEPTGRLVSGQGAALFRLRGELISSLWVLGDLAALEAVLGANRAAAASGG
jgi:predicted ester cyclase